jgi:carbamoylphosphate synthase large subunit
VNDERRPPARESGAPANTDEQNLSKRLRHFEVSEARKVAHAIASVDRAIRECGCSLCVRPSAQIGGNVFTVSEAA